MFYDYAKINVKGGDGGNGCVAFRREKYVPLGGPAGGDGGNGGGIILEGDSGLRTLVDFKYQQHYKAERGVHGQGKNMHGHDGADLILKVPLGTIVKDAETNELLGDIVTHGQTIVVAAGGRGGRGNTRFFSARNKAPEIAEKGAPGQERWLVLELKLLADVALIGMPNAGKSTIISMISAAKPKIADYPFTTLTPNLGVVDLGEGNSFTVADIPGLIVGAHEGAGLGHQFLRHLERVRLLIHVLDMTAENPVQDFKNINAELALYKESLSGLPQIIAANKMDVPQAQEHLKILQKELGVTYEIFPISAATNQGLTPLMGRASRLLQEMGPVGPVVDEEAVRKVVVKKSEPFTIMQLEEHVWQVKGQKIEELVAMTDFDREESVKRLQRIMIKMGIEEELREKGALEGDSIIIGKMEFEFS